MTRKMAAHHVPQDFTAPTKIRTPSVNQAEEDIDRAVARVHRIYGPDLSVFFRAIQNHLQFERREKDSQDKTLHAGG